MRRTAAIVALVLVPALAMPALAGPGKKCAYDTQPCLDQLAALRERGWLGIDYEKSEGTGTMTVSRVVPGSPAEAAGLRAGDELVAVNGVRLAEENEARLAEVKKAMVPGGKVTYTVRRDGAERPVEVTLGRMPQEIFEQMVGAHMLEHATPAAAAKK